MTAPATPPIPAATAPTTDPGTTPGTTAGTATQPPSPTPTGTGQLGALQTALAAEHAVIWGYGMVGAKAGEALLARVREADGTHRARRDDTVTLVTRYGGEPVATQPSYALPFRVTDRSSALRLAVHLEEGTAAAWRYAVAATDDVAVRRAALVAVADAAVRAARWRLLLPTSPVTVPFPGG